MRYETRSKRYLIAAILSIVFFAAVLCGVRFGESARADGEDVWDGSVAGSFESGSGSSVDPFVIKTGAQLAYLAAQVNAGTDYTGAYFSLSQNINLNSENWTPIGALFDTGDDFVVRAFNGSLLGGDRTISNLSVPSESELTSGGLFGYVGPDGSIADLVLSSATIYAKDYAGGIVGSSDGAVEDCTVSNVALYALGDESVAAGGVVGVNYGAVRGCEASSITDPDAFHAVGGVVGASFSTPAINEDPAIIAIVEDCTATDVTLTGDECVGGAVGQSDGTVNACIVNGADLTGIVVGGVIGQSDYQLTDCKTTGVIAADAAELFGGVVGRATGTVSGAVFRPGTFSLTITRANSGDSVSVGGIVGSLQADGTLSACYAHSFLVSGDGDFVGGIVGSNAGAVSLSYAVATLCGKTVGGIVGSNGGTIEKVLFVGENSGVLFGVNGMTTAGGIAGANAGAVSYAVAETNVAVVLENLAPNPAVRGGIAGTNTGSIVGSFFDAGAVDAYDGYDFGLTVDELTSVDFVLSADADFVVSAGKLPALDCFKNHSADPTDPFVVDMTAAITIANARYTATVGEDTLSVSTDFLIQLPGQTDLGYDLIGWDDGETIFDPYAHVQSGTYTVVRSLKAIERGERSGNVTKVYDGVAVPLTVEYTHDLPISYEWYYSADGENYFLVVGATNETYNVTNVLQSGYYYLKAIVTDGVQTVENANAIFTEPEDNSEEAQKEAFNQSPFVVEITKATYSNKTHESLVGGTYDPNKTLANYALNEDYYWIDDTIRPNCAILSYDAFYNADSDNYFDYFLSVGLTLTKASYQDITHDAVDFGQYTGGDMDSYGGLDENFRWANPTYVPSVTWLGEEVVANHYAAYYNADNTNYNDFALTVTVMIALADYEGIEHGQLSGTYDPAKTLADYPLDSGFSWDDDTVRPTCVHNYDGYAATYCADPANYNPYHLTAYVVLDRAATAVTVSVAAGTYYAGENLPEISVSSSSVPGTVAWNDAVLLLGEYEYAYTFTPNDSDNYAPCVGVKTLTAVELTVVSLAAEGIVQTEYCAFDTFIPEGMTVYATYANNSVREVASGVYTLSYASGNDHFLCVGESEVIDGVTVYLDSIVVEYNGVSTSIDIRVHRVFVTDPIDNNEYRFDGAEKTSDYVETTLYTVSGDLSGTAVGTYYVTATLKDATNYYFGEETDPQNSCVASWTIGRGQISVPTVAEGLEYNGSRQYSGVVTTDFYTVSGVASEIAVGTYEITLSLINPACYEWADETVEDKVLSWGIAVKAITVPVPVEHVYTYDGTEQTYLFTGEEEYYSIEGNKQTYAGTYEVAFSLNDDNYVWANYLGTTYVLEWTIGKRLVPYPTPADRTYVYDGNRQYFEYVGDNVLPDLYYAVDAGAYDVTFSLANANFVWEENPTGSNVLRFVVEPKPIAIPVSVVNEFTYDGESKSFAYEVSATEVIVTGNREIEAGEYEANFSLKGSNYVWSDGSDADRKLSWSILPKKIGIPTADVTTFVYDGNEKVLSVMKTNAYDVSGDRETSAGNYSARLTLTSTNYVWSDETSEVKSIAWKISPLVVNKPTLSDDTLVYTGDYLTPAIPTGPYYVISGNRQKNVGNYTATVNLSDKNNYVWQDNTVAAVTIEWSISIRVIDVPIGGASYTYTGKEIVFVTPVSSLCDVSGNRQTNVGTYTAVFQLPDVVNNVWSDETTEPKRVSWSIKAISVEKPTVTGDSAFSSHGATAKIAENPAYLIENNEAIQVGEYTAHVKLKDKKNYTWADGTTADLSLAWKILPIEVPLPIKGSDLLYSGREQTVSIIVSEDATITGNKGTNVGKYTAVASLKDKVNYVWSDGSQEDISLPWEIYTLSLNVGTGTDQTGYVLGTPLPTPTQSGYVFGGWYTSADFSGSPVTSLTAVSGDVVLYAKWTPMSDSGESGLSSGGKQSGGLSTLGIIGIAIASACTLIAIGIIILAVTKKSSGGRSRKGKY